MSSDESPEKPGEQEEPTLVAARPARRAPEPEPPTAAEPTFVGQTPPRQLTNDTDEFDVPKIETPIDFDAHGRAKEPMFQTQRAARSTGSQRELSPIDSIGREIESFGATMMGFWRGLVTTVRSRLRPMREQAAATWSRLRGAKVKEFEQHGEDTFDRKRARQWESFNRGRTSSSYLQDTERHDR
ncbi:MAG: hypothetical protein AAF658_17975 [Myxococcota bacterium]